jgi:hypothetical protein
MVVDSGKETHDESNLEKIAALFLRHGVDFLVIGGQAEILMGSPRVTYDTDLCYRRDAANLASLAAALQEIRPTLRGAPPNLPLILDVQALSLGNNYTFDTAYGPLDLLRWVEPLGTFEALAPQCETYEVGDLIIRTIGLEDLIQIKQHLGRPKDRESLLQLLAIREVRSESEGKQQI